MDHHARTTAAAAAAASACQLQERGQRIKEAAELGLARSSGGRQWGRALRRRLLVVRKAPAEASPPVAAVKANEPAALEGGEEEVVEEKVEALRRLVPGGEEMAVERLLEETADYIAALRAQVSVMRELACLLSGLKGFQEKVAGHWENESSTKN